MNKLSASQAKQCWRFLAHRKHGITEVGAFAQDASPAVAYVRTQEELFAFCRKWSGKRNVYVGLNPRPAALAGEGTSAKDADIEVVLHGLIDIDPKRPKDTDADPEKLGDAEAVAQAVDQWFRNKGFALPLAVMSGNGYHRIWSIPGIEVGGETEEVKGKLLALLNEIRHDPEVAAACKEHDVSIDATYDLRRVTKIPGTLSRKGKDRDLYRLAKIIRFPKKTGGDRKLQKYIESLDADASARSRPPKRRTSVSRRACKPPQWLKRELEQDKKLKATWAHKRTDLKDTSRSGYDMALAAILTGKGKTRQEIEQALLSCPRSKARERNDDYLDNTITKALDWRQSMNGFSVIKQSQCSMILERDGIQYSIDDLNHTKRGMKATVSVSLRGQLLAKDSFLLPSARCRDALAKACKDRAPKKEAIVKEHLLALEDAIRQVQHNRDAELRQSKEQKPIPKAQRQAALKFLKSPKLLYKIGQAIKKNGVAGEERNTLILYLVMTSRLSERPLSILIKGDSSEGKSYLTDKVLDVFPKNAYVLLSDATRQSFYYAEKDKFSHRIIVIYELQGSMNTAYPIRILQSEGRISIQVTTKNRETGEFETKQKEQLGPIGFITTTTKPLIHPENETRSFSLFTDGSEAQTQRIHDVTAKRYQHGSKGLAQSEKQQLRDAHSLLDTVDVEIPYADVLKEHFPKKPVRIRRDFPRFLALIEASAMLHQRQRPREQGTIVASIADYEIAKVVSGEVLTRTVCGYGPQTELILEAARDWKKEKRRRQFTRKQIAQHLDMDKNTVTKWMGPALSTGDIEQVDEHAGNKAATFVYAGEGRAANDILPATEKIAEALAEKGVRVNETVYDPLTGKSRHIRPKKRASRS